MSNDELGLDAQVRVFAEELREANAKLAAIRARLREYNVAVTKYQGGRYRNITGDILAILDGTTP